MSVFSVTTEQEPLLDELAEGKRPHQYTDAIIQRSKDARHNISWAYAFQALYDQFYKGSDTEEYMTFPEWLQNNTRLDYFDLTFLIKSQRWGETEYYYFMVKDGDSCSDLAKDDFDDHAPMTPHATHRDWQLREIGYD